jgi:hypothetical protein
LDEISSFEVIICGKINFHAHCFVKLGMKMDLWEKVGNVKQFLPCDVLFRVAHDYGCRAGKLPHVVSEEWATWEVGDVEPFYIGKISREDYNNTEIGMVIAPDSIVHRIQTGEYDFVYPTYKKKSFWDFFKCFRSSK